jgi:hypothetical protein
MSDEQITNRVFFTMLAMFAVCMVLLWYVMAQVLIPAEPKVRVRRHSGGATIEEIRSMGNGKVWRDDRGPSGQSGDDPRRSR